MRYLISYDIEPDKIRTRIAKTMEAHGTRVQKSVFECELARPEMRKLVDRLRKEMEATGNGSIRVYRLCSDCVGESWVLGSARTGSADDECIVINYAVRE